MQLYLLQIPLIPITSSLFTVFTRSFFGCQSLSMLLQPVSYVQSFALASIAALHGVVIAKKIGDLLPLAFKLQ